MDLLNRLSAPPPYGTFPFSHTHTDTPSSVQHEGVAAVHHSSMAGLRDPHAMMSIYHVGYVCVWVVKGKNVLGGGLWEPFTSACN